ncbi:MAG: PEP-CTERM sorting domain-containing protein [Leptolyngbyaceae cyanobacterium RU_5_1]|nr:PEP-CTERM sorting domain-containing protein [Leptolyngbyaceae cyanobacterium RU_5_1]
MKVRPTTIKPVFLLIAPLITSSAIVLSPNQANAATLALSENHIEFSGFNFSPESTGTFTNTNATVVSNSEFVRADANALAFLSSNPPRGESFSIAQVLGDGAEYAGLATGEASLVGQFSVQNQFSFNFKALLNLKTFVDDSATETARAGGELFFALFADNDLGNPIDVFSVRGFLDTPGNQDNFGLNVGSNVSLSQNLNGSFGGNTESIFALFQGSYQRAFDAPKQLTLVQGQFSSASTAAVPEPTTIVGVLLTGVAGMALKRKKNCNS